MKLLTMMAEMLHDFAGLIYPNLCITCDNPMMKQEKLLCTNCLIELPRTYYHLVNGNPVEQIFWGRVSVEKATAYFIFQKGSRYQKLIHQLKYKGAREVGIEMGRMYGNELKQTSYFDAVDLIIPVPLHPVKEQKRGYNQSLLIAEGLAQSLGKPVEFKSLYRKEFTETQTRKGRYDRWENVNSLFAVKNETALSGKHLLLVDDIVTTGATLEACTAVLLEVPGVKVSIATLGYANQ
ncbi:MAG: ComF family protein [Prolixibacteraceae bacterium]|nr:ComF family protein [Prolixibacteraceae bacterium]